MKILVTPRSFVQSGEKALQLLRDEGFQLVLNESGKTYTEEEMIGQCSDIDGIIVGIDPMTEQVIQSASRLKAISKYGAGLDNIDTETAKRRGIRVDRAAGTNATSVAELAVGLFFSLARSIPYVSASTKNGGWGRRRGVELSGKTIGIIGMGNIGKEVARMSHGLGMSVIAYDPYIHAGDEAVRQYSVRMQELPEIYENADFISLHLPLTEETRHMICKESLERMKSTAFLVNTSRGELVDEDALYEALKDGVIAGAAEDVFSKEPPEDAPLLTLDNFYLTSHVGAFTKEANEKMAMVSAMNLIRMLEIQDFS